MKKTTNIFILAFLLMIGFAACKNKTENKSQIEVFQESLTEVDTTEAMSISRQFMEDLKAGNVDKAIGTLVVVDTAMNVTPISDEYKNQLINQFKLLPVLSYTVEEVIFEKPDSNYVVFQYVAQKGERPEDDMKLGFRTMPVKIDGKWHLTLPNNAPGAQN